MDAAIVALEARTLRCEEQIQNSLTNNNSNSNNNNGSFSLSSFSSSSSSPSSPAPSPSPSPSPSGSGSSSSVPTGSILSQLSVMMESMSRFSQDESIRTFFERYGQVVTLIEAHQQSIATKNGNINNNSSNNNSNINSEIVAGEAIQTGEKDIEGSTSQSQFPSIPVIDIAGSLNVDTLMGVSNVPVSLNVRVAERTLLASVPTIDTCIQQLQSFQTLVPILDKPMPSGLLDCSTRLNQIETIARTHVAESLQNHETIESLIIAYNQFVDLTSRQFLRWHQQLEGLERQNGKK